MKRVFVLGEVNLDILCNIKRIAKKGQESHIDAVIFSIGGNAANFSVALGRLGIRPELVSAIGTDFATGYLTTELKKSKIKTNLVKLKERNGLSIVLIDDKGERRILSNKGATGKLTTKDIESKILNKIKKGDLIYIGGYFHLRNLRNFDNFLKKVKEKKATVFFDLCFDEYGEWMSSLKGLIKHIDLFFMDRVELKKVSKESNITKAIKKLQKAGMKKIVLKLGSRGSMYYSIDKTIREGAIKVKCIDSTGAGDVFNAGFVFGFLNNYDIEECLRIGNFVAGKKIQKHGIILPSKIEISSFLRK